MFRAFARGDVKAMWIQVTNPWVTMPNLNRFERKPGDGRFVVVSDIYPTPTTEVADLILPSAAWVEREGVFGNTERRTQQWNKMVEPPGEAREDAWQIMEVAKRMGMGTSSRGPRMTGTSRCTRSTAASPSASARTSPPTSS